jgi:hypothetical protein
MRLKPEIVRGIEHHVEIADGRLKAHDLGHRRRRDANTHRERKTNSRCHASTWWMLVEESVPKCRQDA